MTKRYFLGIPTKDDCGFMMCSSGSSGIDNLDYVITTNGLKSDEVPDHCQDAKDFSQLMAGLLNAYYSGIDVSNHLPEDVIIMGIPELELGIPSPKNTELPF